MNSAIVPMPAPQPFARTFTSTLVHGRYRAGWVMSGSKSGGTSLGAGWSIHEMACGAEAVGTGLDGVAEAEPAVAGLALGIGVRLTEGGPADAAGTVERGGGLCAPCDTWAQAAVLAAAINTATTRTRTHISAPSIEAEDAGGLSSVHPGSTEGL